ncbi:hypothetical protein PALB_9990 [Pseudoalteromonas luteoviolacea B = ATCC 29581]|nr:hypothetical protein PALB_9990 [Pseudoalteromonas luteoviolacea B = ATCC 29581]
MIVEWSDSVMNRNRMWLIVLLLGMSIWTYKVFNTALAYIVAKSAIENRVEIDESLGQYNITYDWWFGVFRALRYGEVQEFEFHLAGNKSNAISVVEVVKKENAWVVTCVNVVNGEYLNKKIIHECNSVRKG